MDLAALLRRPEVSQLLTQIVSDQVASRAGGGQRSGIPPVGKSPDFGGALESVMSGESAGDEKQSSLEQLHFALDMVGIADPSGIVDASNAAIYLVRALKADEADERKQHLVNAAISGISAIPYAGDIAKGFKYASKASKAAKATGTAGKAAKSPVAAAQAAKGSPFAPLPTNLGNLLPAQRIKGTAPAPKIGPQLPESLADFVPKSKAAPLPPVTPPPVATTRAASQSSSGGLGSTLGSMFGGSGEPDDPYIRSLAGRKRHPLSSWASPAPPSGSPSPLSGGASAPPPSRPGAGSPGGATPPGPGGSGGSTPPPPQPGASSAPPSGGIPTPPPAPNPIQQTMLAQIIQGGMAGAALGGAAGFLHNLGQKPELAPGQYSLFREFAGESGEVMRDDIKRVGGRSLATGKAMLNPFSSSTSKVSTLFESIVKTGAELPGMLTTWGEALKNSQMHLRQYNGVLATALMESERRDMVRNIGSANATGYSTARLTEALSDLKDELQPIKDEFTNLKNEVTTVALKTLVEIAKNTKELAEFVIEHTPYLNDIYKIWKTSKELDKKLAAKQHTSGRMFLDILENFDPNRPTPPPI